jgi:hypothetical protein
VVERLLQERSLELVPAVADLRGPGMLRAAVQGGVDVAAAGEEQACGAVERGRIVWIEAKEDVEMLGDVLIRHQAESGEDLRVAPRMSDGFSVGNWETSVAFTPLTYNHYVRPIGLRRMTVAFRDIQSLSRPLKWSCYV